VHRWRSRTVRRQGSDHALAALVQVMAAIIAMLSIPLLAPFFPHAFDRGGWLAGQVSLTLHTGWEVALQVARVQVLPLLLGLALLFAYQFGDEVYGLKLAILLYALLTALISTPMLRQSKSRRQTS